jgi:hypothetical protein
MERMSFLKLNEFLAGIQQGKYTADVVYPQMPSFCQRTDIFVNLKYKNL